MVPTSPLSFSPDRFEVRKAWNVSSCTIPASESQLCQNTVMLRGQVYTLYCGEAYQEWNEATVTGKSLYSLVSIHTCTSIICVPSDSVIATKSCPVSAASVLKEVAAHQHYHKKLGLLVFPGQPVCEVMQRRLLTVEPSQCIT